MSSKGKKSGKKQPSKSIGDVTINDFANAKICKNRPKKSVESVTQTIKQLEVDDRAWDEKTEDDFDLVEEENDDGTTSFLMKRSTNRRRRKTVQDDDISQREGIEYPIDIWFLISEHIDPEDVGRFSGICRSTYSVVCTTKFWINLYKRCYKNTPSLPKRLQPEQMFRKGLRACVIRALYFMYPPFVNRIRSATALEEHPHNLLKRKCILMWHSKYQDKWLYYFKLKENCGFKIHNQRNSVEMLKDALTNSEDGCRILQVCCPYFIPTPLVLGLTLTSVSLTLSQGFRHQRLQMGFGSGLYYAARPLDSTTSIEIILDPVINVRVLDWWHPLYLFRYPHTNYESPEPCLK